MLRWCALHQDPSEQSGFQVMVRLRPLSDREVKQGWVCCWDQKSVLLGKLPCQRGR